MTKSWFTITNKADEAEIDIHDEIGLWGVSSNEFVDQLRAIGSVKNLTINLDSPGGDCNDGFTIYDAIMGCKASVTVNVTGLAASMASVIMLAADKGKLRIAENGRVMIHRVTGGAHGNSDDLAAATQLVKQFEDRIVALYVARSGKAETEIRDMMKAQLGTWFFGQDAVDAGFADSVISGTKARAFKPEWASLFTMLPAALFLNREKEFDKNEKSLIIANQMSEPATPAVVAEPSAPAEIPPVTPAEIPVNVAEVKALGAKEERQRVTEITTWAKAVEDVQKIDLAAVTADFVANGKSLADFKEHVITNTFKAKTVATVTDTAGAQGNTMKRDDFNKLSPFNQSDFCRKGGKITD